MRIAQTAARTSRRRPMLLALVFGVVLVLIGVTASALAALVSAHLSTDRLNTVVANEAALVGLFVNDKLLASDLDDDGPTAGRAATLSGALRHLIGDGGIVEGLESESDAPMPGEESPALWLVERWVA